MPNSTNSYTSLFQVLSDANSHILVLSGRPLSLSSIQAIAQARWEWIVNNWIVLYPTFKTFANGSQALEQKLDDFQRFIESYRLGNLNNPLDNLDNFIQLAPFLDLVSLSSLKLSPDESSLRDIEIDRLLNLDIEDFKSMISFLKASIFYKSDEVGLGDADASRLLGLEQQPRQRSATVQDLDTIEQVTEVLALVQTLLLRARQSQRRAPNVLALTKQFIDPLSPVVFDDSWLSYVPQPFEVSLEHMAQKYLGDRSLWFELATINNLQPPFIDEAGEKFSLLAPPATNNLIIADTRKQDIPVGTKIGLGSYRFKEEQRIVERTILNENGTMILFLSGAQDISRFKPAEGAFVRVYKPGTTRPGSYVLIPSRNASAISTSIPTPTRDDLRRLDSALLQFGVDIARDSQTGDVVFDPSGNFKLAAGLSNVKQAVLSALKTTRGELPFHPNYGVSLNIGAKFFGTTDEALLFGELLRDTLLSDGRLEDVRIAKIATTGTGIAITLMVSIAGASQPLPLSFVS